MTDTSLGYLDAARAVLREADRPLTVKEIVSEAVSRGLLSPRGKTPEATMSASLYVACKRQPEGDLERVWKDGPTRAMRDSVRWCLRGRPAP